MVIISLSIFYFFFLPLISIDQLLKSSKSIDIAIIFFALVAVILSLIIAAQRWSYLMGEVRAEKSQEFMNALGIFCLGQVTGLIVPSRIGNYSKIFLIKKMDKISYETGLSAVNAETILDLGYICCAGVVSFFIMSLFFSTNPYLSSILFLLLLVFLLGIILILLSISHIQETRNNLITISLDAGRSRIVRTVTFYLGKLFELIISTKEIFSKKLLTTKLAILTLFAQLSGVIGLYFVIESLHSTLPLQEVFAILTISYIVGIVSLVPGGFGTSDLSLIILLENAGIPLMVSTNIAIFWRIVMYLPIFLIIGLYFLQRQFLKRRSDLPS